MTFKKKVLLPIWYDVLSLERKQFEDGQVGNGDFEPIAFMEVLLTRPSDVTKAEFSPLSGTFLITPN